MLSVLKGAALVSFCRGGGEVELWGPGRKRLGSRGFCTAWDLLSRLLAGCLLCSVKAILAHPCAEADWPLSGSIVPNKKLIPT